MLVPLGDGYMRRGLHKYNFNLLVHLLLRRFCVEGRDCSGSLVKACFSSECMLLVASV